MIYLITGSPGAGKTSNTLWEFMFGKQWKDRPKYATPIRGFDYQKNSVVPLDGISDWQDLPDGALILVDEAQNYIPATKDTPEWVRKLSEHRHRGFDFLFITQMGSMVHHHVRGLVHEHIHYHEAFGLTASRYVWQSYQRDVNSPSAKAMAEKRKASVDKRVFDLYESTTVDTKKVRLPVRWLVTAGIGISLILFAIGYMIHWSGVLQGDPEPASPAMVAGSPGQIPASGTQSKQGGFLKEDRRVVSLEDYIPRNRFDPSSAPIYDHLTEPTDFPRVAACINRGSGCSCYSQQATPVQVPEVVCKAMVQEGWFDPWKTGRAQAENVLAGRPEESTQRVAVVNAPKTRRYWSDLEQAGANPLPSETFIPRH
jgi:zona occludens toxin